MTTINKAVKLLEEVEVMQKENAKLRKRTDYLKLVMYKAALEADHNKLIELAGEMRELVAERMNNYQAIENRYAKIKENGFTQQEIYQIKWAR
jgi:roadblock/LC7 domain-containing protein